MSKASFRHARIAMLLPVLALVLGACAAKAPPAPPPPPPPPPAPTDIVLEPSDMESIKGALRLAEVKPVDEIVGWTNPATGKRGTVKMIRDGFDEQNRLCREFHMMVALERMFRHQTGFVCRQPDGVWEVVQAKEYPLYRLP
ncbi:MAG TPA: RT0821/Lpp0805 family surface protein [Azospirillaceae bacterium]|nr:RT0821/Lpp0805 family surface protein [Azospirillaceae bacterium]